MSFSKTYYVALIFLAVACSQTKDGSSPTNSSSVQLFILKENWHDLSMGYEPDGAQSVLIKADVTDNLSVIGLDQIEQYDWDLQTITLTKRATINLVNDIMSLGDSNVDGLDELQNLKESVGLGNPVERALYIHAFIVKVDEQFKYGGIFLDATSQMAIDYPVIRVTIVDDKAIFAFLPVHIPFSMNDLMDGNGNLRESDIQQLDFFGTLATELATSETAVRFRSLIRDEEIKQIFEGIGKLKK